MAEYKLELKGICKSFPGVKALDNVQLSVRPGTVHALMGENGAGKSTAIKCISGLLRFQGEIKICGYPNKSIDAKRNFGYIPEIPAPYENLTVMEHLEFIGRAYQVSDWEQKAKMLLSRFEMSDKTDKSINKSSIMALSPFSIASLNDDNAELIIAGCVVLDKKS